MTDEAEAQTGPDRVDLESFMAAVDDAAAAGDLGRIQSFARGFRMIAQAAESRADAVREKLRTVSIFEGVAATLHSRDLATVHETRSEADARNGWAHVQTAMAPAREADDAHECPACGGWRTFDMVEGCPQCTGCGGPAPAHP